MLGIYFFRKENWFRRLLLKIVKVVYFSITVSLVEEYIYINDVTVSHNYNAHKTYALDFFIKL